MANELTTPVPGMTKAVRGVDAMLSPEDVARLIDRPVRFVREKLFQTGVLRSVKFGCNSYRTTTAWFNAMLEKGATGFKSARGSGRRM